VILKCYSLHCLGCVIKVLRSIISKMIKMSSVSSPTSSLHQQSLEKPSPNARHGFLSSVFFCFGRRVSGHVRPSSKGRRHESSSPSRTRSFMSRDNSSSNNCLPCFTSSSTKSDHSETQSSSFHQRGSASIGEFQRIQRGSSFEFCTQPNISLSSSPQASSSPSLYTRHLSFEELRPTRQKDERGFLDRAFENAATIDEDSMSVDDE